MGYIKTNLCLTIKCKCGACVAATMIYGGMSIDEDFTETIASVYNDGGKIQLVNTDESPVKMSECKCK